MNLEIHKNAKAENVRIDINEVFPPHYKATELIEVCETEARFIFDALKNSLPQETKQALIRMIERGGLAD